MSDNCSHPTCFDSPECRRPIKTKKRYQLKRTPIKRFKPSTGDLSNLTHAELLIVAQNAFNAFIRNRDRNKPCVCGCGGRVEQAGHFYPSGSFSGVRFDEINVNGIGKACNYFKSTPAIDPEYEAGLIARVGITTVLKLTERAYRTKFYKWEREDLIEIIQKYKA